MTKQQISKEQNKFLEQKIKAYDLAINGGFSNDETYYLKALNLIKLARKKEALECLIKAIAINANELAYHAYLAKLNFELGECNKVKEILEEIGNKKLFDINNARNNEAKNIIIELQKKIQNLENASTEKEEKQNLEHRIENLEEKKQELEHRIEALEKDSQKIKEDMSLLQDMIEKFVVKRVISSIEYKNSHSLTHQESTDNLNPQETIDSLLGAST